MGQSSHVTGTVYVLMLGMDARQAEQFLERIIVPIIVREVVLLLKKADSSHIVGLETRHQSIQNRRNLRSFLSVTSEPNNPPRIVQDTPLSFSDS